MGHYQGYLYGTQLIGGASISTYEAHRAPTLQPPPEPSGQRLETFPRPWRNAGPRLLRKSGPDRRTDVSPDPRLVLSDERSL